MQVGTELLYADRLSSAQRWLICFLPLPYPVLCLTLTYLTFRLAHLSVEKQISSKLGFRSDNQLLYLP